MDQSIQTCANYYSILLWFNKAYATIWLII